MRLFHPHPGIVSAAAIAAALIFFVQKSLRAEIAAAETHVVKIQAMAFSPQALRIKPGDTVTWINGDLVPHAVQSTEAGTPWRSKDLQPKESWSRRFDTPARYFCPFHPNMTGEIVIEPAQPKAP